MSKIRIKNIEDQLLVSLDNKTVTMHDKSNVNFSIEDHNVKMTDGDTTVFTEETKNFIEPEEVSPVDLMLLLNSMITTPGVTNVTKINSDYTATNYDSKIETDVSGSSLTVKMPRIPELYHVWEIIDDGGAGANTVIIDGDGYLINGNPTETISLARGTRKLYFNGNQYILL